MNRSEVQKGILKSWNVITKLNLAETISNPAPLPINEEFRDVILSSESDYLTIYTTGLTLSHYNFLLSDYSFFQFGWSSRDHVRYAFYPNPFIKKGNDNGLFDLRERHEQVIGELITHEEYLDLLRDLAPEVRIPIIRYKNAPNQYKELHHPCSQFSYWFAR